MGAQHSANMMAASMNRDVAKYRKEMKRQANYDSGEERKKKYKRQQKARVKAVKRRHY
jgi:hypothetical protein